MKKRLKAVITICLTLVLILINSVSVFAEVPYRTWTAGPNGRGVTTQTAYEPSKMLTYDLNAPEDVFVDNAGIMYIADTGNSKVLIISGNERKVIGEGILKSPSGIFVDNNKNMYIADYGAKKIFVFDKDGKVVKEIGKPTEPIYGKKNDFVPKKVAVDNRGNIYVISEGSINGVVQINKEGKFAGFVGSNKTDLSFKMIMQRFVFTSNQKGQLFKVTPPSPTSISIDEQGLLHTVTSGVKSEGIKKLNITGSNILPPAMFTTDVNIDIDVDKEGNIYTLDSMGYVNVYDSFGNLLFAFGGKDVRYERVGMFKNPVALDVTDSGDLYVVDKERNVIYTYKASEFANKVKEGVNLYKQGLYVQSKDIWKDILKMNSSFILSYKALANANFKQQNYSEALNQFRLAEDQKGYSDAYWQIRNTWLQDNMTIIILILIVLLVIRYVLKKIDKKLGIFNKPRQIIRSFKKRKLIAELGYSFRFFKHPIDSFYEIKHSRKASVLSATILYLWLLIIQILSIYIVGFTFSTVNPVYVNLSSIVSSTFVPVALFIVANYLVSTISEGEGRFSDIYISTIYSLTPYLVIALPVQLLSNVLTLNEAFVYSFALLIAKAWSAILLIIMVKEIHDYTFKETVKNILVTAFGMLLIILIVFILFILFNQEVDFVKSIIQELRIRG